MTQRRLSPGIALFFILTSAYILTYRGFPLSQDGLFIYDSTESLVNRGDFKRTYEFAKDNMAGSGPFSDPWAAPNQEPLISILLAPVYLMGRSFEQVGTLHIVWTFNIVITALTGASVFAAGLLFDYTERTSFAAGLIYGLATLAWPYARFLFREPLMALLVLWCFVAAVQVQARFKSDRLARRWISLMLLTFIAAFLTKAISIVMLPALFIMLLPPQRNRRLLFSLIGLGVLLISVIGLTLALDGQRLRYSLDFWISETRKVSPSFLLESLLGYHISWSRSLWLHSPVLLVGIIGAWQVFQQKHWRRVLGPLVFLLSMSVIYGIGHQTLWWGGWGWGPRYLLPVLPVMMVFWVLPVLPHINTPLCQIGMGVLIGVGIALQLLGMAVPLPNYYTDLNWSGLLTDFGLETQWGDYNWTWKWSPLKYHLERLELNHLDSAWHWADVGWLPALLAVGLLLVSGGFSWWLIQRERPTSLRWLGTLGLTAMTLITMSIGVHSLRTDARYIKDWTDVHELAQMLNQQVTDNQIVFIDRELYLPIFMNYFKRSVIVGSLPYSPGENYGDGPEVVSEQVDEQIGLDAYVAIQWAQENVRDVWLVASSSPFEPDKLRPVERFLATTAFPVEEITISDRARAIRFDTTNVYQVGESDTTDFIFNNNLRLLGYNLPKDTRYTPGEVVPVSLTWEPQAPLKDNYNVAIHIATTDGFPLAQRDGQPQGTFGAMTQWQPQEAVLDHHGLQLPADIPPGTYHIQVVVYRWQDGTRLTWVNGETSGDIAPLVEIVVE